MTKTQKKLKKSNLATKTCSSRAKKKNVTGKKVKI